MVRRAGCQGLIEAAPVAAVDATGLETRHVSAHFGQYRVKGKSHRQRTWPKLTVVLHTGSSLVLGAVPGLGPSQDAPDFTPAIRRATGLVAVDTILGDAGYDAEHNHRLCREDLGVRQTVIRSTAATPAAAGRQPRTGAMRHRFPKLLFHQRRHVESEFSQHKRRLGSALTARRPASQNRGLVLRVLTHNLMLLAEAA